MNSFRLLTVGGPTAADGYAFRKYQPSLFYILDSLMYVLVKEKTRESVDSLFRINERVAAS